MYEKWFTAFYWVTIYVIVIFGGQKLMTNRQSFHLRVPLFLWNSLWAQLGQFSDNSVDNYYLKIKFESKLWVFLEVCPKLLIY